MENDVDDNQEKEKYLKKFKAEGGNRERKKVSKKPTLLFFCQVTKNIYICIMKKTSTYVL